MVNSRSITFLLVFVFVATASAALSYRVFFISELERQNTTDQYVFQSTVDTFHNELVRYKQLVRSTVDQAIFIQTLEEPKATNVHQANQRLKQLVNISGALDLYLLDANGITLAASNWDLPRSFVGQSYAFRPYFIDALRGQLGQYHALGTRSLQRGIYLAHAVQVNRRNIGVIAVKIDVDRFERNWNQPPIFMVRDRYGIVFMSNLTELLYRSASPLSDTAKEEITQTQQYPINALSTLPATTIRRYGNFELIEAPSDYDATHTEYMALSAQLQLNYLTLSMWSPTTNARNTALISAISIGIASFALLLISFIVWNRRQQMQDQQRELESRVAHRTRELSNANELLEKEIDERRAAQQELIETQANLVQASKLSALGQLSASLSHELNQPLAAIRNYADNAVKFIERNQYDNANNNLDEISELTSRMARIIKNLRTFSKPSQQNIAALIDIEPIIEDALLLLAPRIEQAAITIDNAIAKNTQVLGGQVRLQQVFINVFNNAIDALIKAKTTNPTISITSRRDNNGVVIVIEDNGAGIDAAMLPEIFNPFSTTKSDDEGDGLGLGLYISYNIIQSFGGTIKAQNVIDDDGSISGAQFSIYLKSANDQ